MFQVLCQPGPSNETETFSCQDMDWDQGVSAAPVQKVILAML